MIQSQLSFIDPIESDFRKFNRENPVIYTLFKEFTFQAINRGHKKLSSEMIINRIRWETSVMSNDKDYKINNNYKPFYSRMFMNEHPQYKDFFYKRTSKADMENYE
tara:strand:+ start:293 stop:610 length:318 start_codon:yes stop_codon:yes gene_type:complete